MATFYRAFASEFGSPPTMLRAASQGRVNGQRTTGKDTS